MKSLVMKKILHILKSAPLQNSTHIDLDYDMRRSPSDYHARSQKERTSYVMQVDPADRTPGPSLRREDTT
jgi:hypothetical protein